MFSPHFTILLPNQTVTNLTKQRILKFPCVVQYKVHVPLEYAIYTHADSLLSPDMT